MVPPQCGWGRTAFGSTHEPRSTHNPLAGPPRTASTRGPGRSSRIPAPSQRPGPRPGRGDGAGPDRGRVSVNKFPEGFPGCRVFGLPGQGSGLPSLSRPCDRTKFTLDSGRVKQTSRSTLPTLLYTLLHQWSVLGEIGLCDSTSPWMASPVHRV